MSRGIKLMLSILVLAALLLNVTGQGLNCQGYLCTWPPYDLPRSNMTTPSKRFLAFSSDLKTVIASLAPMKLTTVSGNFWQLSFPKADGTFGLTCPSGREAVISFLVSGVRQWLGADLRRYAALSGPYHNQAGPRWCICKMGNYYRFRAGDDANSPCLSLAENVASVVTCKSTDQNQLFVLGDQPGL